MPRLGEDALDFARWYLRNKFALMEEFLRDLDSRPEPAELPVLRDRFLRALRRAQRVLWARLVVTILLAFSLVATVSAAVLNVLDLATAIAIDVDAARWLLARIAAVAGSLTLVLVVARLAFDRYLDLVQVSATFVAIEIASARAAGSVRARVAERSNPEEDRRGLDEGANPAL